MVGHMLNTRCHKDRDNSNAILTLKPESYPIHNHNSNPTYPNKPTEPYQTVLTITDTAGLQCAPSDHISRDNKERYGYVLASDTSDTVWCVGVHCPFTLR